jgi:hypothetical protein
VNERDYLIMESMVIAAGCFVVMTVVIMMLLFDIPIGIDIVLVMSFIGFTTFFFGLLFHMKRRIFILEMQALAKEAPHEVDSDAASKLP